MILGRTVVALCSTMLLAGCGVPSDSSLMDVFQHHRDAFEELRGMAQEDYRTAGIQRVATSFVQASGTIDVSSRLSSDRLATYRRLFGEIHAPDGLMIGDTGVSFIMYAEGFGSEGSEKTVVWSTEPPDKLYPTLDGAEQIDGDYVAMYREIAPQWYLEYERTP